MKFTTTDDGSGEVASVLRDGVNNDAAVAAPMKARGTALKKAVIGE